MIHALEKGPLPGPVRCEMRLLKHMPTCVYTYALSEIDLTLRPCTTAL